MKHFILSALIVGATAMVSFVSPASAQATRTWVSGVGDDANPCSRTAPCKTFAGAISKTAANGEINCLDSAGYGQLTILKAMAVVCNGVVGSVLVSGTNGMVINVASTDKVFLQGIEFEGLGTGLDAVRITGSGNVEIDGVTVRRFTGNAVSVVGTAGLRVSVNKSSFYGNGGGVLVQGTGGNNASVTNSLLDANNTWGIEANGAGNNAFIFSDVISSSTGTGLIAINGGSITSFGPSSLVSSGSPTTTLPLK
jgi:hypothetical protein